MMNTAFRTFKGVKKVHTLFYLNFAFYGIKLIFKWKVDIFGYNKKILMIYN